MINKLKTIWQYFSLMGIHEHTPFDLRRRLVLSNQVCFAALILISLFLYFVKDNASQAISYSGGMLLCVCYFLFMKWDYIKLARIIIIIGVPILTIILGYFTPAEVKLTQKTSITNLAIVPLVFFGISEKRSMIIGLIWVMCCYVLYDWVESIIESTYTPYRSLHLYFLDYASAGLHLIIVSLAFVYLQRINYQSETSLNELLLESNEQKSEIADQKNRLIHANQKLEILNLRTKMNPHFLYNSLNAIQRFITENDKKSSLLYLTAFSRVMRSYLYYNDEGMIPLEQEVELLKEYLKLENMRSLDRFDYQLSVIDEVWERDPMVPFMLIQPFVENAIVHGVLNRQTKGLVKVLFKNEGEYLLCSVIDDGIGREASNEIMQKKTVKRDSKGVELSLKRLNLIYNYSTDIKFVEIIDLVSESKVPLGTHVNIRLPYRLEFGLESR